MPSRSLQTLPAAVLLVLAAACGDDSSETSSSSTGGSGPSGSGGATAAGQGGGPASSASGTGGSGGAGCDDSGPDPNQHTAGTCSNLGETSLVAYCDVAIAELDPGVAYAAISCLANACLEGPGCTTDEYRAQAVQCLIDALADACPDASADAACAEIEPACASSSEACHAHLDGMTAPTRAEVVECANADCSAGLRACVEEALAP
jgi:hypothetical protein